MSTAGEPGGPPKIHHYALKAISGLFALILAPIIVTLGAGLLQKKIDDAGGDTKAATAKDDKKEAEKTPVAAESKAEPAEPKKPLRVAEADTPKASIVKTPKQVIRLFNGRDKSGFYTYLGPAPRQVDPVGKDKEPPGARVFYVQDAELHITGRIPGAITTVDEYENYHLVAEYKWGELTHYPVATHPRSSGIILHSEGPDGEVKGAWMPGVQVQIIENRTGDMFLFPRAREKISMIVAADELTSKNAKGETRVAIVYKPRGASTPVSRGLVSRLGATPFAPPADPAHARNNYEKPHGQWNTLECICDGDSITVVVNGKKVNAATQVSHHRGRIQIMSEGAAITFRKFELRPL
jgi:hypothetical protein